MISSKEYEQMAWRIAHRENTTHSKGLCSPFTESIPIQTLDSDTKDQKGSVPRVIVRITRRSVRYLDTDNLYGSVKGILDALVAAGVIKDDSPENIDLQVGQEKCSHRKDHCTVIEITYRE